MIHAKEALKSIPDGEEEEDYYDGEGGSIDSISTEGANDDGWLEVPSQFSLKDATGDLRSNTRQPWRKLNLKTFTTRKSTLDIGTLTSV